MPDAREALREEVAQRIDRELDGDCGYGVGGCLADVLMPLFAAVWSEGADYAGVEMGLREGEFEAPGDNPYLQGDPS